MSHEENESVAPDDPTSEPQGAQAIDDDALEFVTGGTGLCLSSGGECAPPATNTTYSYSSTASVSVVKPVNTTIT